MTKRVSGLSMPMPNAVVATTTSSSSSIQARWVSSRSALLQPRVVRPGAQARGRRARSATSSVPLRVAL